MLVVEGRQQPDLRRLQRAVAEYVAGHVADAGHGEGLALNIAPEFPEMALDALPATARGDPHLLVVVAGRAARGEGIAEPEAGLGRDRIGNVGKRGRALVGGHDQVRIIAVEPPHLRRRRQAAADDVVGEIEQAANETLVAADDFALLQFARCARRQPPGHEPAPWRRPGR